MIKEIENLDDRFLDEIEKRKFNIFEIEGFKFSPKLGIKCGIAIGYQMALKDCEKLLKEKP